MLALASFLAGLVFDLIERERSKSTAKSAAVAE
jgi:hypothetical protein